MCFKKNESGSIFFWGGNIPSYVSYKQGVLKKCNLTYHHEIALLTTLAWQAFYCYVAPWEKSGPQISLVLHSSPLFLGEQSHFVQPFLPSFGMILPFFVFRAYFWASSKLPHKVQDHYNRQKCSEIAHHCQLITKNPLIADIIINYIPIMTGTIGLSVFLALLRNPKQCRLVGENDLDALRGK